MPWNAPLWHSPIHQRVAGSDTFKEEPDYPVVTIINRVLGSVTTPEQPQAIGC